MSFIERLIARLEYELDTGLVTWTNNPLNKFPGQVAGALAPTGYWVIMFENAQYRRSRIAHVLVTGEWPEEDMDHIDGNTNNDQWLNLRPANKSENLRNTKLRSDNTSGSRGVSWAFRLGKWHVRVNVNRKLHHIGYFDDFEEAKLARDAAAERLHGEFARFDPQTT